MGGGDLNLKKSWHPHTMKNQEKVWKAEQAKNAEDRKMNDLRKEIMEEKNREELVKIGQNSGVLAKNDDKKLEWMYKSSSELINREEYLLGRPIDKAFESLVAEEQQQQTGIKVPANHVEHECVPFSIRAYRNATSTEQVDLQRKILEDPLMMIKQKEMESRRKILENPVKLKELHRILKTEKTTKEKSKKGKKSKKSKKTKRKKSKSDDSEDSDKNLDELLQKQYKKLKGSLDKESNQLAGLDLSKLLDAKYETISKELDKAAKSKKSRKKSKRRSSSSETYSSSSQDVQRKTRNERDSRRSYRNRSRSPTDRPDMRRGRSGSPMHRRDQRMDRQNFPKADRRNCSSPERNKNNTDRNRSRSPQRSRHSRSPNKSNTTKLSNKREDTSSKSKQKERLTKEEKEKRLKDMMENAAWRDKERTRYVQNYREGYRKEEEQNKAREFDKEFLNIQLRKAMSSQNSVESRIKSKVNNIQRTSSAMNSNFTKK